ncbi:hypothetical protein [Actinomadura sp. CNU-125]|uniref:hypothetical protein n=1 Tax=Actinomadura sp. CNU-125 TaxID=1904961 RepID=UPI0021CCA5B9|nr:hypothetical protein [Actinomadura sp. CNU-125]
MSAFLQYLISGIAVGCGFALLASGLVAIHRVTRVVNFAQGMFAVVGGMTAGSLLSSGLPHVAAEAPRCSSRARSAWPSGSPRRASAARPRSRR